MDQRAQQGPSVVHGRAGPHRIVVKAAGLSDETVKSAVQDCWYSAVGKGNAANFPQTQQALQCAFHKLQPVCPIPNQGWYKTVFRNYDQDQDGRISYDAFVDIVRQYHAHHAEKQRRRGWSTAAAAAAQQTSLASARADPDLAYTTHRQPRLNVGGPSPRARLASSRSGRTTDGATTPQGDAVTLASHIMYPNHRGQCQIFQDYSFIDATPTLGRGSFGTVQVVQHKLSGKRRACKKIAVAHPEQWDLISTEIQLMKSLNHPNILRLHETYHDGHTIYLLMELCEGGQLFDRIVWHYEKCRSPITEEQVAEWMRQILSATAYCHDRGIVHRDIKPENILFVDTTESSPIKVIDFGLSSTMDVIRKNQKEVTERKTGVGAFMAKVFPKINGRPVIPHHVKRIKMQRAGTPHYMAPEMIKGYYDEKCDVFSVGVIMYQLLSGVHPFFVQGVDNEDSVKQKILSEMPPLIGDSWTYVSSAAKKLVRWMLEKNPAKRCSAEEAVQHQWFMQMSKPVNSGFGSQLTPSLFDGLRDWQNQNRLKQAVLQLLAKELSESEITDLRKKFMALDKRRDGTISLDELQSSMQQAGYNMLESEMKHICGSLGSSGDSNRIGYNEFISALLAKRVIFEEVQLREVFNKFDTSGDGFITTDSLRAALKGTRYGQLTEAEVEMIFNEIDKNGDGCVDFYEFMDLMTNA